MFSPYDNKLVTSEVNDVLPNLLWQSFHNILLFNC